MGVIAFIERRAWVLAFGALVVILLLPGLEISLSTLFFNPLRRIFLLRSHPFGEFVRKTLPYLMLGGTALIALAGLAAAFLRRSVAGIGARQALYVVACLALGPGLVVNLLKDYWGRPRPSTTLEFSGPWTYTPFIIPSDQCPDNCSFPSGHAALGFWTVSLAMLVPAGRRRRAALWAATGFGAMVGLVRIAQGGHFLSDVIASGMIVTAICQLLYKAILVRSSMTNLKNNGVKPAETP